MMEQKALIAIVSDHTDIVRNELLAELLDKLCTNKHYQKILDNFGFIFTGGTFNRMFYGFSDGRKSRLSGDAKEFLYPRSIRLPSFEDNGVTILSYIISRGYCNVVFSFQTPNSPHHNVAQNSVLRKMCDVKRVRRLINTGSIIQWLENFAMSDLNEDLKVFPEFEIPLKSGGNLPIRSPKVGPKIEIDETKIGKKPNETCGYLGFVVRKKYRGKFLKFMNDYAEEISKFEKILITQVDSADTFLSDNPLYPPGKIIPLSPIGEGGLTEISMEILFGRCDDLILFDDTKKISESEAFFNQLPLNACKREQNIRTIMGIEHAIEWAKNLKQLGDNEQLIDNFPVTYYVESDNQSILKEKTRQKFGPVKFVKNGLDIDTKKMKVDLNYGFHYEGAEFVLSKTKNGELKIGVQ